MQTGTEQEKQIALWLFKRDIYRELLYLPLELPVGPLIPMSVMLATPGLPSVAGALKDTVFT